ncbi:MAG: YbhB/YbcL family Raf kinase inhibitor-like protein [bacterium]
MRKLITFLVLVLAAVSTSADAQGAFKLSSKEIAPNAMIGAAQTFSGFGCTGPNISPSLAWSGAPAGTKSFALTMYDPDAPTGSGWWHWTIYNIPASAKEIALGAGDPKKNLLPAGAVEGPTDFGKSGYGGPCPPAGDKAHRYVFTLYALKTDKLDIPAGSTPAFLGFNISGNKVGSASFTARYKR